MNKLATAVGVTGLGAALLWSGITNAGMMSTIQSLVMGAAPIPGQPQTFLGTTTAAVANTSVVTGTSNSAIANDAMQYVGKVPYDWGGKDTRGWDCYGFLTYVLHHDMGYNLPNNTYTGYLEFLSWGQKYSIPASQVQAGDIVIWPTHCGIAISSTEMVSAENYELGTAIRTFQQGGPLTPEPMSFYRIQGNAVMA